MTPEEEEIIRQVAAREAAEAAQQILDISAAERAARQENGSS